MEERIKRSTAASEMRLLEAIRTIIETFEAQLLQWLKDIIHSLYPPLLFLAAPLASRHYLHIQRLHLLVIPISICRSSLNLNCCSTNCKFTITAIYKIDIMLKMTYK